MSGQPDLFTDDLSERPVPDLAFQPADEIEIFIEILFELPGRFEQTGSQFPEGLDLVGFAPDFRELVTYKLQENALPCMQHLFFAEVPMH